MGNQTVDELHRVGKKYHGSQWGPNCLNTSNILQNISSRTKKETHTGL